MSRQKIWTPTSPPPPHNPSRDLRDSHIPGAEVIARA